jgi:glycerol-3-phosphate dehydrogenase
MLEGGKDWTPVMYIKLVQDYGLEPFVANHLANTYGDVAFAVAKMGTLTGKRWPVMGQRLHTQFPYIEAEVRFAVREYACTAVDVIARRLRIAFLNVQAAEEVLPRVVEIMAQELNWSKSEQKEQHEKALEFLRTEMGQNVNRELRDKTPINLTREEVNLHVKGFHGIDKKKRGYITLNELRESLKDKNVKLSDDQIHALLSQVDISKSGQIEMGEYLELMYVLRSGVVPHNTLAKALENRSHVTVERSGGGL